ncbi:MAG: rRNA pseudouridine synthase [Ardenticatenia bacterium]|nr:rRNA pseudouridine synthase [Ardenticatenia bacterium]
MQRLNKLLAHLGIASRRGADEIIAAGRLTVNGGTVTELGQLVDPDVDEVRLDGERLSTRRVKYHYLALNKPRGVITTLKDPQGRPTVADLVPRDMRVVPVGRLDAMSEGLLLLTNDGDLTNELTHPRHLHEKEYRIKISGTPNEEALSAWRHGMYLLDEDEEEARVARRLKDPALQDVDAAEAPPPPPPRRVRSSTEAHRAHQARLRKTLPAIVKIESSSGSGTWLRFTLTEGRNRQIRRMIDPFKHQVHRLIRTRVGPIRLGDLKSGLWRELTAQEVAALKGDATALTEVEVAAAPRRAGRPVYKEGWARPKPKADRPGTKKGAGLRDAKRDAGRRDGDGGATAGPKATSGPRATAGAKATSGPRATAGAKATAGPRATAGAKATSGPRATAGAKAAAGPKAPAGAKAGTGSRSGSASKPSAGRGGAGKPGGRPAPGKRSTGRG